MKIPRDALSRLGLPLIFALAARASMAVKFAILPLHLTNRSFSPIEIGLVAGVGNVVAIFFSPWAGAISDRISKRVVLTMSGMGIGVSLVLFAIVSSSVPALAVAIFLAISATFLRLALIVSAVEISSQRRTSVIGLLNGVNSLGSSFGSILAGWIADRHGYAMAFPMCALPIVFVSTTVSIFGGWRPAGKGTPGDSHPHRLVKSVALQAPKRIALPILFLLCDMGITVAWKTFLPIHLVGSLGWSAALLGGLIAAQNLTYSICQPLSAYLADRLGYKLLLVVGLSSYGILVSLIPLASSTWSIYGLMLLSGAFASPIYPTSLVLAADVSSKDERGTAMGFMMASSNLAGALGPSIAGLIVSMAAVPSAGFAYCFVPALIVSLVGQLFLAANVSLPSRTGVKDEIAKRN